jgi:hypothetical protein
MECLVSKREKNKRNYLIKYIFFVAVYQETNTIWFSDFYDEEEEALYKLIGVSC